MTDRVYREGLIEGYIEETKELFSSIKGAMIFGVEKDVTRLYDQILANTDDVLNYAFESDETIMDAYGMKVGLGEEMRPIAEQVISLEKEDLFIIEPYVDELIKGHQRIIDTKETILKNIGKRNRGRPIVKTLESMAETSDLALQGLNIVKTKTEGYKEKKLYYVD